MAGLPFMQFYPALYLQDTRHLTCEAHGAYLLLLMDLWIAGGTLPNDAAELAERVKLPPAKWAAVWPKLARFFTISEDDQTLSQKRITADLEHARAKSETRAEIGRLGGKAKAQREQSNGLAIANQRPAVAKPGPQHLEDERDNKEAAQPPAKAADWPEQYLEQCFAAVGLGGWDDAHRRSAGLLQVGPLLRLRGAGYSFAEDVLPALTDWKARRKQGHPPGSWEYFMPMVVEHAAKRAAMPQRPAPAVEDWPGRVAEWRKDSTMWAPAWGPRPGESGCRVPAELLERGANA